MRKRLPESAKQFIERFRNESIEQLSREVNLVVTGSTEAFGGDRAILIRELLASSSHVRIFTALGMLHGLNRQEVFEVYKSLSGERQVALDTMVKHLIAEEIEDQKLREPSATPPIRTHGDPPITLSAELKEIEAICSDLGIPRR